MDLDNKSKFVEMHQMAILRQMLTFAREALHLEVTINLQPDFSGSLNGDMNAGFDDIGQAVEAAKNFIRNRLAKEIDNHNQQLRAHVEETKQIAKNRDAWKELGEKVLAGKYEIPEEPIHTFLDTRVGQNQYMRNIADMLKQQKIIGDYSEAETRVLADMYKQNQKNRSVSEKALTQAKKAIFGKMCGRKP